jgi:hypothetical protein
MTSKSAPNAPVIRHFIATSPIIAREIDVDGVQESCHSNNPISQPLPLTQQRDSVSPIILLSQFFLAVFGLHDKKARTEHQHVEDEEEEPPIPFFDFGFGKDPSRTTKKKDSRYVEKGRKDLRNEKSDGHKGLK